jgi:Fe-S cluster assembly ATP-binding protein
LYEFSNDFLSLSQTGYYGNVTSMSTLLHLNKVAISVESQRIVHEVSLIINSGELHILMGPNGSGKSSLVYALMGHPRYTFDRGIATLNNLDLVALSVDKRAREGLFLAVQQPPDIPGVSVFTLLKQAYMALTSEPLSLVELRALMEASMQALGLDPAFLDRSYEGFSGGQKKCLELLQLLFLKPKVVLLDELDSGLDQDAQRLVQAVLTCFRKENPQTSFLIITHYPRFVETMQPDRVHIMHKGCLVHSGSWSLAQLIEQGGYDELVSGTY